jgi:hypothetical protein
VLVPSGLECYVLVTRSDSPYPSLFAAGLDTETPKSIRGDRDDAWRRRNSNRAATSRSDAGGGTECSGTRLSHPSNMAVPKWAPVRRGRGTGLEPHPRRRGRPHGARRIPSVGGSTLPWRPNRDRQRRKRSLRSTGVRHRRRRSSQPRRSEHPDPGRSPSVLGNAGLWRQVLCPDGRRAGRGERPYRTQHGLPPGLRQSRGLHQMPEHACCWNLAPGMDQHGRVAPGHDVGSSDKWGTNRGPSPPLAFPTRLLMNRTHDTMPGPGPCPQPSSSCQLRAGTASARTKSQIGRPVRRALARDRSQQHGQEHDEGDGGGDDTENGKSPAVLVQRPHGPWPNGSGACGPTRSWSCRHHHARWKPPLPLQQPVQVPACT